MNFRSKNLIGVLCPYQSMTVFAVLVSYPEVH